MYNLGDIIHFVLHPLQIILRSLDSFVNYFTQEELSGPVAADGTGGVP